jgi:chitin disaccharide deacetylase
VRQLIVNADDFGLTGGVTLGILEAHQRGIVTSTSLMVDTRYSPEAARLSRRYPNLSVGLHATLTDEQENLVATEGCLEALDQQFARFYELTGRSPTHLDSHHNVHRLHDFAPLFRAFANRRGLPLREHSPVRYVPSFYGQWDGETHPEQISPDGLRRVLIDQATSAINELGCHPGHVDKTLHSFYSHERTLELQTLCSPEARVMVMNLGFELVSFAAVHSTGIASI